MIFDVKQPEHRRDAARPKVREAAWCAPPLEKRKGIGSQGDKGLLNRDPSDYDSTRSGFPDSYISGCRCGKPDSSRICPDHVRALDDLA